MIVRINYFSDNTSRKVYIDLIKVNLMEEYNLLGNVFERDNLLEIKAKELEEQAGRPELTAQVSNLFRDILPLRLAEGYRALKSGYDFPFLE